MAYNDSGPLSKNAVYQLGQYQFKLNVTKSQEGDSTQIQAQMTKDGQSKYHSIYEEGDATVESWSVEANETEATVYCTVKKYDRKEGKATDELFPGTTVPVRVTASYSSGEHMLSASGATFFNYDRIVACSKFPVTYTLQYWGYPGPATHTGQRSTGTHNVIGGKDVYYDFLDAAYDSVYIPERCSGIQRTVSELAYIALYGDIVPEGEGEITEVMVARFEIDLETADGGPDGDWDEPGDSGDPSYTLNLSVTGATAGTHDALVFPSDNTVEKGYGCGGDGGHGGGGGAGASTVIIYEFATSKAGNVNQEAYTREPGVGSGGGKGGKGGDGCILIFY